MLLKAINLHLPAFHAWCYKSDGRLVKVKAPSEYCEDFDKSSRGLKQGRIASYRGFVFVSLDTQATDSLEDFWAMQNCSLI